MKKIIWIAFAALAALWTGFVALTLQLANWVLSLIAGSQVPGAAALGTAQWNPPAWAAPWVDPSWLKGLQESLVWAVLEPDPARGRRPGHLDLGAGLDLLGVIMAALLVLALILHWLAGKRQQAEQAGGQVVG